MKSFFKTYFYYTASELRGVLVLFILLLIVISVRFFLPFSSDSDLIDTEKFQLLATEIEAQIAKNELANTNRYANNYQNKYTKKEQETVSTQPAQNFYFNPNTATKSDFERLGLSPKTAQSILNYRNKGGQFRKVADFKKIYTLKAEDYNRLQPFITIKDNNQKNKFDNTKVENTEIPIVVELFEFNPNEATKADFEKLGLSAKTAQSILNYRNKGGQFRKVEDLKKIYTLKAEDFERLKNYINIPEKEVIAAADKSKDNREIPEAYNYIKKSETVIIDLNMATVEDLQQLKGIGAGFAKRIIEYRNSLGGFINKTQLLEVYNFKQPTLDKIETQLSINKTKINTINLNTADVEILKNHPYLNYKQANAIIKYRKQHGNFQSLERLNKIYALPKTTIEKVKPYLSL